MVVHFVTQPQGQPVVQPFFTQVVEIDFSFFCSLRNVFFIQESDWEGNQSYSNFLEVCKLAGVLTTINKPTTGLLSLPNMDNYTATRASPAPAPDFNSSFTLFSLTVVLLSIYSSLCQSQFAAIFVATFSGKCCSQLLRSDCFLFTSSSDNPSSCFDSNRQIGMSHSSFTRRTANMQRDLWSKQYLFTRSTVCSWSGL